MKPKKSPPKDWPRVSSSIFYEDANAAIDWLCTAFGFEVRLKVEGDDGDVAHSELVYGEGLVMVGSTKKRPGRTSPRAIGGSNTQSVMVHVDDVDAHCAQARATGAKIVNEPTTEDYGDEYWSDRHYGALDCEGHLWWFAQRVRG
jgi:uncharacterized glyoxalase superfamily protein PhnB